VENDHSRETTQWAEAGVATAIRITSSPSNEPVGP